MVLFRRQREGQRHIVAYQCGVARLAKGCGSLTMAAALQVGPAALWKPQSCQTLLETRRCLLRAPAVLLHPAIPGGRAAPGSCCRTLPPTGPEPVCQAWLLQRPQASRYGSEFYKFWLISVKVWVRILQTFARISCDSNRWPANPCFWQWAQSRDNYLSVAQVATAGKDR